MKRFYIFGILVLAIISTFAVLGCERGAKSEKPPIHPNPNMDDQPKYISQAESEYFVNGAASRQPVAGTVARGELRDNTDFFTGKDNQGKFIQTSPLKNTEQLLKRGEERYNIYCAPCHHISGNGKGKVIEKGFIPPPTFVHERVLAYPDGEIYHIITNGFRNMPSYKHQIPVKDRWAIVAHMHELQKKLKAE